MLEQVPTSTHEGPVYRLVNQVDHIRVLRDMGLDQDDIGEMIALLRDRGITEDPAKLLDGPFDPKPLVQQVQTRFSDGSVRVFYSALDADTTEKEMRYWYMKPLLLGQESPLTVYYRLIRCTFEGEVKDLRTKVDEWPFLIADDGYAQCNRLGTEAASLQLGALLSRSARDPVGTTVPVFARACLSGVELHDYRVFRYDPETEGVTVAVHSA